MILDNLKNSATYARVGPRFEKALAFLQTVTFDDLRVRKTSILGEEVFALKVEGKTQPESAGLWEAHRRYADIHFLVSGGEAIGYAPVETLTVTQPCEPDGDDILLAGKGRLVPMVPGEFMILFPPDAHMTGVSDGINSGFQKIVVKVLVAD